jgi:hypothetical protein
MLGNFSGAHSQVITLCTTHFPREFCAQHTVILGICLQHISAHKMTSLPMDKSSPHVSSFVHLFPQHIEVAWPFAKNKMLDAMPYPIGREAHIRSTATRHSYQAILFCLPDTQPRWIYAQAVLDPRAGR